MSSIPIGNSLPVTTGSSSNALVFTSDNTTCNAGGLTLTNTTGVATHVTADGKGNLRWGASVDGGIYKNHTFSKPDLETKIKEFHAGKYTRKYMEVYLDFMVMNAMLDNLEYLEYKVALDKELS